jgi:hypothetical protein
MLPLLIHPACLVMGAVLGTTDIRLNEIMYAPTSPEPEWIELINRGSEPVNLKKWQLSDASPARHLLPANDIIVQPGGFLILTRDSSVLRGFRGPVACSVISVPGFPSLNNGGDAVVLLDMQGNVVDSLTYLPGWGGNDGGRSLERRDADAASSDPSTWGTCLSAAGATPGLPNSIRRLSLDLSISVLYLPVGTVDTVVVTVRNDGRNPVNGFDILLYDDRNLDSVGTSDELATSVAPAVSLSPGDSVRVPLAVTLSSGVHRLIAVAEFPADERFENNRAICDAMKSFSRGVLLVNEIMAEPGSGRSEYAELVNTSAYDVDVKGWSLTDLTGSAGRSVISAVSRRIHPGEYLVVAADSSLFRQFPGLAGVDSRLVVIFPGGHLSLNNDGDAVVIKDVDEVTIDSVLYSSSWHNPDLASHVGRSLERISPTVASGDGYNWGTCVDASGGTPCRRNSLSVSSSPARARLSFAPNPFSPDGDGYDDVIVIHYEMPLQTSIVNVKIFDIQGRLIRRLASNEPGGPAGDIVWDGRDESGTVARIGVYIALLEAANGRGGLESAKGVLVLARKL